MKQIDLSGKRFGKLQVIKLGEYYLDGCGCKRRKWLCKCDCGNTKMALSSELRSGKTKSCGCLKHEAYHTTHGLSKTRLFSIWSNMKSRCTNPNVASYKNYGERGIFVCEEWMNDFESFYKWSMSSGYADSLTLDRINNDGNYEPSNCRWATREEQRLNRKDVKYLTFNGKTLTQKEWGLELGGGETLIECRLLRGWSLEKALTTPPRKRRNNGKTGQTVNS